MGIKKVSVSESNYDMLKKASESGGVSMTFLLNKLIEQSLGKGMTVAINIEGQKKSIFDKYTDRDNATSWWFPHD